MEYLHNKRRRNKKNYQQNYIPSSPAPTKDLKIFITEAGRFDNLPEFCKFDIRNKEKRG
jgi:hypothetical protein